MFHKNSAQSSFLRYEDYHPGKTSHYLCYESKLTGKLNIGTLQHAMSRIVKRHKMLRSSLPKNHDGRILEIKNETFTHEPIHVVDISDQVNHSVDLKDTLIAANASDFLNKPFDLEHGPLWRAIILKTAANQWQLAVLMHPCIADQRSINILFAELSEYYNQVMHGQYLELVELHTVTTLDVVNDATRLDYWYKKLEDLIVTKLHTPKSFNGAMRFQGKHKSFSLDNALVNQLKSSMPDHTLEEILLASIYTLLNRYTGEADITIGTTDANRPENDNHINSCTSWLTMRLLINEHEQFIDLLKKAGDEHQQAHNHQLSIEDIYQTVLSDQARATLRTTAPFDVLLKFNKNEPTLNLKNVCASTPTQVDLGYNDSALFQLTVNQLADDSCDGFINFNTDLFDEETIDKLLGHWQKILSAAAQNPACNIHDIPLPLEAEITAINEFNNNAAPSHFNNLMTPEAFSTIANDAPDHTALVFHPLTGDPERTSFRELDDYTNQIANYLHDSCKLEKGDHIALSITRSTNLVALTIGALKAGLVIVPLETTPGTLFAHKFKHANAKLVITDQHTNDIFQQNNLGFHLDNTFLLNIDEPLIAARIKSQAASFQPPTITADDPAYIMFSSGTSTGIPKASLLTHGGLVNLFNALRNQNYAPKLNVLCTALPTFDAFLFDFLAAWVNHGTVHLTTDEERYSPEAVERIIRKEGINFAVFLPDLMSLLPPDLPLDYTISMGAAPREGTFERWLEARPGRKIINGLGHTETGICLSLQEYEPGADPDLVGAPINNMKMFVLNPQHHTLCPIGVPGEIFVSGPGLATEYIGNAELTRNKFLTMKFDSAMQKFSPCEPRDTDAVRLYASGDYGCYQKTNQGQLSIKSIGRTDRRIKLFGVSIDLDGVEALISTNQQVQAVAVIPKPDMSGLLAYVVRNRESRKTPAKDVRNALRVHLRSTPLHPVAYPKRITLLTELPKTANGKIDLKKLPVPPDRELSKPHHQDLTQILAGVWRDVLGSDDIDDIDTNATFEEMGGNSIALAALEIKINKELPLSRRIGAGTNSLSKNMSISSLSEAIRPLMKSTLTTNHASPPVKPKQITNYCHNRGLLFSNKTQAASMNYINPQIQDTNDNKNQLTRN